MSLCYFIAPESLTNNLLEALLPGNYKTAILFIRFDYCIKLWGMAASGGLKFIIKTIKMLSFNIMQQRKTIS